MDLTPIPLFGLSNKSRAPSVTDQERVNLYSEISPDGERGGKIAMYCPPGLTPQSNYGASPNRGAWSHGDFKYVVNRDKLYKEANDGSFVEVGTLLTSGGIVDMIDNGNQLMIVDGTYGYIYVFSPVAQTISTITRVGTLATLTTAAPHGLGTGMTVLVAGALPAQYNGSYSITVTSPTTFTYVMASDPGGSAAPVGTYSVTASFSRITSPAFRPIRPA
jgi:hypothetical protein